MQEKRKPQTFLQGALILMGATLVVKIIGVFYKIPLTRILGGTGMGYYMTAYGLFNPIHALAVAGLPVAVSKLVSEQVARGRYRDAKRIFRLSLGLFLVTGLLGTGAMALGARLFADGVGNPAAFPAVLAMAPAVFFGCVMSAFRGYYEGLRNMVPTALSQVVEAVVRLVAGIFFAAATVSHGMEQFAAGGLVYGVIATTSEEAMAAVLPVAAAAAILGITLSTAVGALYVVGRHLLGRDGISGEQLALAPPPMGRRAILKSVVTIAVPVCFAAAVVNLTSLIDLMSVMNRLTVALERDAPLLLAGYEGLIPPELDLSQIPNYLYGCYTGLAVTVFNLVPALTTAFGISALPTVAASWAVQNREKTLRNIESVLRMTSLLAIPAGLGITALAEPILTLLFSSRPMEVAIAAPILQVLGVGVIFVAITTPVNSMLQAVGRTDLPVKLMLLGGGVKLLTNYILVAQPGLNIKAAPYGTALCYALILTLSLWALCGSTGISIGLYRVFGKPLLAGLLCGVAAHTSYGLLARSLSGSVSTLLAVGIGGGFYLLVLLLLRTVTREDLNMLPGGEKVAKMLEKLSLLG